MAAEFLRLINEHLESLSADDPDRDFIEKERSRTEHYIELEKYNTHKQKGGFLGSGEHTARRFAETKSGSFLDIDEVLRIRDKSPRTESVINYANRLIKGITNYGNDSLAHLCLPTGMWTPLSRHQVNTITELRQRLLLDDEFRDFGAKSKKIVREYLGAFDALLAAQESQSQ